MQDKRSLIDAHVTAAADATADALATADAHVTADAEVAADAHVTSDAHVTAEAQVAADAHDVARLDPERPHPDDIREELNRIINSGPFRDAYRLTSFLSFIVEMTLTGNGKRLKAYTIAVEALGRGTDFDPQIDPIVRVEAVRLRQALARYYSENGIDRLIH